MYLCLHVLSVIVLALILFFVLKKCYNRRISYIDTSDNNVRSASFNIKPTNADDQECIYTNPLYQDIIQDVDTIGDFELAVKLNEGSDDESVSTKNQAKSQQCESTYQDVQDFYVNSDKEHLIKSEN